MKLRPVNGNQDTAVMQGLYDTFFPTPVPSLQQLAATCNLCVAETPDGQTAGFRALSPTNFIWVAVIAEQQRRGVGRLLMNDVLDYATASGVTELISRINDKSVAGVAFCERFEFKPYLHMVNLELDLKTWDDSRFISVLQTANAKGIEFKTYADYEDTLENRQRLYTLNKTLSATIPRSEPQPFIDFETYVERRLLPATAPYTGIYLAVDGDQWIGMQQISLYDDYAFNEMTGVLPDYRGYGIAQALKSLTAQFAKRHQKTILRTFNDASNLAMIAVNEKMGFQRGQSFYQVRRRLVHPMQGNVQQ